MGRLPENEIREDARPHPCPLPQERGTLPTSRTAGHRAILSAREDGCFIVPQGQSRIAQRFQRWVGRRKGASPEGTAEVQSHSPSFSRPFGTFGPCAMFPGVQTPGYSQNVPPGQRNLVAAFSAKNATRFTSDAFKAISRFRCPARKMWDTIMPMVSGEKCRTCSAPGEGVARTVPGNFRALWCSTASRAPTSAATAI